MFCTKCGSKATEGALYCIHDGTPLYANDRVVVAKEKAIYCTYCGSKNAEEYIYCTTCGHSMETIHETNMARTPGPARSTVQSTGMLSRMFTVPFLKKSGIAIVVAFGSLLLLSFILQIVINEVAGKWLENQAIIKIDRGITAFDIMLLSHFTGGSFSMKNEYVRWDFVFESGSILLLLIPALGLIIAGFLVCRKQTERTAIERVIAVLPVALIYALLVGLVARYTYGSFRVLNPLDWSDYIDIKGSYTFATAFRNSLIIGIIFTTIGSLLGMSKAQKREGGNIGFGRSIQKAVLTSVFGMILCTGIIAAVLLPQQEYRDSAQVGAHVVALPQLGAYAWNLAHFGNLEVELKDTGYEERIRFTVLGGFRSTDMYKDRTYKELSAERLKFFWTILIVPLLLHFWAGIGLKRSAHGHILLGVGAYAVVFGFVQMALFSMLKFSYTQSIVDFISIKAGFSLQLTFLWSAIFAFVASYIGSMVVKTKAVQTEHQGQIAV